MQTHNKDFKYTPIFRIYIFFVVDCNGREIVLPDNFFHLPHQKNNFSMLALDSSLSVCNTAIWSDIGVSDE